MSKKFNTKNIANSQEQVEALKDLCNNHSVNYEDLNKMLETEKIKKLHKRNHYINQVITDIIEG